MRGCQLFLEIRRTFHFPLEEKMVVSKAAKSSSTSEPQDWERGSLIHLFPFALVVQPLLSPEPGKRIRRFLYSHPNLGRVTCQYKSLPLLEKLVTVA